MLLRCRLQQHEWKFVVFCGFELSRYYSRTFGNTHAGAGAGAGAVHRAGDL